VRFIRGVKQLKMQERRKVMPDPISYIQKDVEWDNKKAVWNEVKHRITHEEAATAFFDDAGLDGEDLQHSLVEPRRLRLARSAAGNLLVIAYTVTSQGHEKNIRIISARVANPGEKTRYQAKED
jgi:uncharacterized protein